MKANALDALAKRLGIVPRKPQVSFGSPGTTAPRKPAKAPKPSSAHSTGYEGQPREHHAVHHDPAKQRLIEAMEKQRKQWERYTNARQSRANRLAEDHPEVSKYLKALQRLDHGTEFWSRRDCDQDLGALARRLKLADVLPAPYDRFLMFELTQEWIEAGARRQGTYTVDDDGEITFTEPEPDTSALGDLKNALKIH